MNRVYTDDRFPGYEVINDGSCLFEIRRKGQALMTFESWERPGGTISEACAARRAADFYDRNAKTSTDDLKEALEGLPPDRDASHIVNSPPSAQHNSSVIDRMIAREGRETDPEIKRRLRHNILHLMKQEDTVAEAVVSHLIEN